jgi:hypothetical protein
MIGWCASLIGSPSSGGFAWHVRVNYDWHEWLPPKPDRASARSTSSLQGSSRGR